MKKQAVDSCFISPEGTIIDAIEIIDSCPYLIALVVDGKRRLIGTVTDGDIRRGILRGVKTDAPVTTVMYRNPTWASVRNSREEILLLMKRKNCRQIPILDDMRRVVDIQSSKTLEPPPIDTPVVLMAGGLGTRLRPLTEHCPKPLLQIGNKPILEIILENFIENRFRNFYISINYKGHMIEDYFGDGSRWGVSIQYLKEDRRMGTAGALTLLPESITGPMIVMNGDLLTQVNFRQLIDFHRENKSQATVCVREYDFTIPFGVVQVDDYQLTALKEKPVQRLFINAGIYVIESDAARLIPPESFFDMPDLLNRLLEKNNRPGVFPIREYWIDIGQIGDYKRADKEFTEMNAHVEAAAV